MQPAWRREVKNRLRTYRERRHRPAGDDSQTALQFSQESDEVDLAESRDQLSELQRPSEPQHPFEERLNHQFGEAANSVVVHDDEQYEDPLQATLAAAARRMSLENASAPAPEQAEQFQQLLIDVSRPPETESASAAEQPAISYGNIGRRPASTLFPVGELSVRRRAGALDALSLLLSYAGILGLFAAFGGRLAPVKLDAFICASIASLLYAQYFTLFTIMGGSTPGMMLAGLRVVGFNGSAPAPRQLILRSFGYLISAGMGLLGFLWAFWDEDHLTWHDRISQTYIVSTEDMAKAVSANEAQDDPPLAHH